MSLSVALNSARFGLVHAEKKIAIVASNINNADRAGYTRKTLQNSYTSFGLASVPTGGISVQVVSNNLLLRQVNEQATVYSYQQTLSTFLSDYAQAFGSTSSTASTLTSTLDTLTSTLSILEQNPADSSAKAKVVSTAQTIVSNLNSLSSNVQDARLRANNGIATNVTEINQNLKTVYDLNRAINTAKASNESTADLEDQRNQAVLALSQKMDIQYFKNDNDEVLIYTPGGTALLGGTQYATLSYAPVGLVSSSTTYPGGFGGIMLNGVDITTSIAGGELGAFINLRDSVLPGEQAKLDSLAVTLKQSVNAVLNQGTAYPPLNSVKGNVGVVSGDPLSGTGTLRVAVTDSSGAVQAVANLNLASYTTVGDLVTALNGITGVSASTASGKLVITATNPNQGISLNPQNTDVGGISVTQYFGFNDLFTNNPLVTLNAETIQVNPDLLNNSEGLATGTLSTTAGVGAYGITKGDASTITALVTMMTAAQSFAAAGNFSSRNTTLSGYATSIITDIATQSAAAKLNADTASATYTYLNNNLSNETGVNVDEETANLTVLQGNYQANAQIIATVKELFQTLLSAVR